jgi:hypothetical protein
MAKIMKKAQTGKNVPKGMVESEMFPGKMIPKSKSNYATGNYSKMLGAKPKAKVKPKAQNGIKKSLTPAAKKKTGMDAIKAVGKYVSTFGGATERDNPKQKDINIVKKIKETGTAVKNKLGLKSGGMLKRADGSYSKRGLWDNIRANRGSGKKPTAAMLKQEKKIKSKTK